MPFRKNILPIIIEVVKDNLGRIDFAKEKMDSCTTLRESLYEFLVESEELIELQTDYGWFNWFLICDRSNNKQTDYDNKIFNVECLFLPMNGCDEYQTIKVYFKVIDKEINVIEI
jgi:hypothetical protein